MSRLGAIAFLATILSLPVAAEGAAQTPSFVEASRQLSQAEAQIRSADKELDAKVDSDEQKLLRQSISASRAAVRSVTEQIAGDIELVDERLAGLGPASSNDGPDLVAQRRSLVRQRAIYDAAVKRGSLAQIEADQLISEIDRSTSEQFSQTISVRVFSPLTPAFWQAVLESVPRDLRRIKLFLDQGRLQIREQGRHGLPWQPVLGLILAAIVLFPVRRFARGAGQKWLIDGAPGHRLRRSANAVWRMVLGTATPLIAAFLAVQGLRWGRLLPPRWSGMLDDLVTAAGLAGFSAAVIGAVLLKDQRSWRIAPISDETATALRPLSWCLALLIAANILVESFNAAVGASGAASVMTHMVEASLYIALIASFLILVAKLRSERSDDDEGDAAAQSMRLSFAVLPLWILVVGASACILAGYVALGLAIVQFISWGTLLGCSLYLLSKVADDVITTVFSRSGAVGSALVRSVGVRASVVEQFGLLLSGLVRMLLVLVTIGLLMDPFGMGGGLSAIFGRLDGLVRGVDVGGVSISPGSILRGVAVLLVGLAAVRAFVRWLEASYLPATDLDGSGRNSILLVARYIGFALSGIWALASLGIGLERIALLLSALSVGIGFGLQAITQNFISGLILLAERPIKIGDLIRVGNDEGDVKRISVRSTAIQLGDHSTLIVPNSELITKPILNKTLSGPLGRIQIQFSTAIEADVDQVRNLVLTAIAKEGAVRQEPAPALFVDGIADGRILFNCIAHVGSPREAYGARSNILMSILSSFKEVDVPIGTAPAQMQLVASTRQPGEQRDEG